MVMVSARMVSELRQKTGLGMMECKKALVESEGDLVRAEELLRIRSGNKASKLAGRVAAEGALFMARNDRTSVLVEINCETDFVARDDNFRAFGQSVADRVLLERVSNLEELGSDLEDQRKSLIARLGENVSVRRFRVMDNLSNLAIYKHSDRIAAMVDLDGGDESVGKDVAIHIVSFKPKYLDESSVPLDVVESERRIAKAQAMEQGKPESIAEKMVEGRIRKFYEEVVLLKQAFVKNDKIDVETFLKQSKATLKQYALFVVGEGIEKVQEDYALAVAAAAGKK